MNEIIDKTIKALEANKIKARYYSSSEEAVRELINEISPDETIGIGGSVTVKCLQIPEKLIERGNKVYFHWLKNTEEERDEARKMASCSDVYLTSTNSLTVNGQLVNIDGIGNRVSSMIYGPKKVIVICGINKITNNLDEAIERIKKNAYKNARRLKLNTPCTVTENCCDCDSPQRMCNVTTIINRKPGKTILEVIIIGEELGY